VRTSVLPWRRKVGGNEGFNPVLTSRRSRASNAAALPPEDYRRLAPAIEVVSLKLKQILHKPGEPLQHVYFPGDGGFLSVVTVLVTPVLSMTRTSTFATGVSPTTKSSNPSPSLSKKT